MESCLDAVAAEFALATAIVVVSGLLSLVAFNFVDNSGVWYTKDLATVAFVVTFFGSLVAFAHWVA